MRNDSKRRGNCCWPLLAWKIERPERSKGRSVSVILGRWIILAALCWSGTKERDAGWLPCREVPCLALPCLLLQAFTSLMQRLWFEVIRTRQNASRHDLRTRQNALRLRRVDVYGSKIWNHCPCARGQELRTTILFWARGDELRITHGSFLGELPWVEITLHNLFFGFKLKNLQFH